MIMGGNILLDDADSAFGDASMRPPMIMGGNSHLRNLFNYQRSAEPNASAPASATKIILAQALTPSVTH